ncbi:hypothetical protein UNPA324_03805 [Bradyrhizobium sp. UNPA324]|nr:hypothetical protein UNPA324_03805 [Bradyrhizobium sp. UNPA324]
MQENPTPELGAHRALEATNLAFRCRLVDTEFIKGSPECLQISLNVLLASFGIEGEHKVNVPLHVLGAAKAA